MKLNLCVLFAFTSAALAYLVEDHDDGLFERDLGYDEFETQIQAREVLDELVEQVMVRSPRERVPEPTRCIYCGKPTSQPGPICSKCGHEEMLRHIEAVERHGGGNRRFLDPRPAPRPPVRPVPFRRRAVLDDEDEVGLR